jgi:hypothetical protein
VNTTVNMNDDLNLNSHDNTQQGAGGAGLGGGDGHPVASSKSSMSYVSGYIDGLNRIMDGWQRELEFDDQMQHSEYQYFLIEQERAEQLQHQNIVRHISNLSALMSGFATVFLAQVVCINKQSH